MKMTTMPQCCKLCGAYQGKVYSISGKDKRFPALFKTVLRNGYALPHPNCRHEFIPWFEEIEAPEDVEKAIRNSKIQYDKNGELVDVRYQRDIKGYAEWQAGNRQLNRELLEFQQMKDHYAGREDKMPYKTLGSFRRASRAQTETYKAIRSTIAESIKQDKAALEQNEGHIFIAPTLGKAENVLREKFNIKNTRVIITDRQYKAHIAKGANTHDDIFDKIKDKLPNIVSDPDYIFEDDKREDTVICISQKYQAQIVVKLNTQDEALANTIITIFGCSDKKIRQLLRNKIQKLLYKKEK